MQKKVAVLAGLVAIVVATIVFLQSGSRVSSLSNQANDPHEAASPQNLAVGKNASVGIPQTAPKLVDVPDRSGNANERSTAIWREFANAANVKAFSEKYRNAPLDSTERFLADYAVLSCGSLTTVGKEKFIEFAERRKKRAPPDPSEDEAQDSAIRRYVTSCRDFMDNLPAEKVLGGMIELRSRPAVEAKALALVDKSQQPGAATSALVRESGAILSSDNPFVVQAMGKIWFKAAHERIESLEASIFRGMSPNAVQASWHIASCSLGIECGPNSEVLHVECVLGRRCLASDVPSYYDRYVLTRTESVQVARTSEEILRAIRERNFTLLGIR